MEVHQIWLLCLLCAALSSAAPLIASPWGRLLGVDLVAPGGAAYSGYLGVPYALPPLGERRWRRPEPHPGPGEGRVFNASRSGPQCPQPPLPLPPLAPDSEDCLTLNVFVPEPRPAAGQCPVLSAQWSVLNSQCSVPSAVVNSQCPVPSAQCSVFSGQWSVLSGQ